MTADFQMTGAVKEYAKNCTLTLSDANKLILQHLDGVGFLLIFLGFVWLALLNSSFGLQVVSRLSAVSS